MLITYLTAGLAASLLGFVVSTAKWLQAKNRISEVETALAVARNFAQRESNLKDTYKKEADELRAVAQVQLAKLQAQEVKTTSLVPPTSGGPTPLAQKQTLNPSQPNRESGKRGPKKNNKG